MRITGKPPVISRGLQSTEFFVTKISLYIRKIINEIISLYTLLLRIQDAPYVKRALSGKSCNLNFCRYCMIRQWSSSIQEFFSASRQFWEVNNFTVCKIYISFRDRTLVLRAKLGLRDFWTVKNNTTSLRRTLISSIEKCLCVLCIYYIYIYIYIYIYSKMSQKCTIN